MEVAKTILAQLGGHTFIAMTGARDFVGGNEYLRFRLPSRFAKEGINLVRITLTPADDYTLEFFNLAKPAKLIKLSEVEGIYADQLQEVFTNHTGLDTHL